MTRLPQNLTSEPQSQEKVSVEDWPSENLTATVELKDSRDGNNSQLRLKGTGDPLVRDGDQEIEEEY